MVDLNQVCFSGFVQNDPEHCKTGVSFRMGIRRRNPKAGEPGEKPHLWTNVSVWSYHEKTAQALLSYVKKGMHITITGELRIEEWKDGHGEWRSFVAVRLFTYHLSPARRKVGS
ncbi:MAG: single-stranded DNA-binding protein [Planctomycetota bacterium]|nr:MAG: single-stranded DNA-binding protein [Planctomycetota bacterium]